MPYPVLIDAGSPPLKKEGLALAISCA